MLRRGLLLGALAALVPATQPVVARTATPILWGDGEHDDTVAIQALLDGKEVHTWRGIAVRWYDADGPVS